MKNNFLCSFDNNMFFSIINEIVSKLISQKNNIRKKNIQIKKNFSLIDDFQYQINKNKLKLTYKIDENKMLEEIYFKRNKGKITFKESIEEYIKKIVKINNKLNKKADKLYHQELYLNYQEYIINNIIKNRNLNLNLNKKNFLEKKLFEKKMKNEKKFYHNFSFDYSNGKNSLNLIKEYNNNQNINNIRRIKKISQNKKNNQNDSNNSSKKNFSLDKVHLNKQQKQILNTKFINDEEFDKLMKEYENLINKNEIKVSFNSTEKINIIHDKNNLIKEKINKSNGQIPIDKSNKKKINYNKFVKKGSEKKLNNRIKINNKSNNQFIEAREKLKQYLLKENHLKINELNHKNNLSTNNLIGNKSLLNKDEDIKNKIKKNNISTRNFILNETSDSNYHISSEIQQNIPKETYQKNNIFT